MRVWLLTASSAHTHSAAERGRSGSPASLLSVLDPDAGRRASPLRRSAPPEDVASTMTAFERHIAERQLGRGPSPEGGAAAAPEGADDPPPPPPEPAYATPAPPPPWLDASPSAARQLFDREGGSFSAAAGSGSDSDDTREPELISWIRKAAQIDDDDDDYPDLR